MDFHEFEDVTFTSTGKAIIDGKGGKWWGLPGIGYLAREENRPKLIITISASKNILLENTILTDSPHWTFILGTGHWALGTGHGPHANGLAVQCASSLRLLRGASMIQDTT